VYIVCDNVCDFCVFCSNRFARNLTDLFQITHNILLKDLFESVLFLSEGHCGLSELPFGFALGRVGRSNQDLNSKIINIQLPQ